MAYNIRLYSPPHGIFKKVPLLFEELREAGFVVKEHTITDGCVKRLAPTLVPGKTGFAQVGEKHEETVTLLLNQVRLLKPKPYCGNHAGPCPAGGPKPRKGPWLETDDWIKVHETVNNWLDQRPCLSEAWTESYGHVLEGPRLWVRRGGVRRRRWDYVELVRPMARLDDRMFISGQRDDPWHHFQFFGPSTEGTDHCLLSTDFNHRDEVPKDKDDRLEHLRYEFPGIDFETALNGVVALWPARKVGYRKHTGPQRSSGRRRLSSTARGAFCPGQTLSPRKAKTPA